ncbi:MAG: toll/interleukin-1 receptor domain-containing protein [Saprospiraceae bacterium]|nr:toll/interleukin-1 receptor domain-containing protein [Saprospiraceae bacterium]
MNSNLIIQIQEPNGNFTCEIMENIPSPKSAYIAIAHCDSQDCIDNAHSLKSELIRTLQYIGGNKVNEPDTSCKGLTRPFGKCQALKVPDNSKLLIIVGDGKSALSPLIQKYPWKETVLPVFKKGSHFNLPSPFNKLQCAFWENSIHEVTHSILGILGISDEDLKIFISYKRSDTSELAEQLFDELSHHGFEVFLDQFSIRPGVNFQNRLEQELADKAMIVMLESQDFLESRWVQEEIAFAKKNRLGVMALNIDGAKPVKSIDDEFRIKLTPTDFISEKRLSDDALKDTIARVNDVHSLALFRKKNYMVQNVLLALKRNGGNPDFDTQGFVSVSNSKGTQGYKIWVTPRPPKIQDFYYSDVSKIPAKKIIFGPRFWERKRDVLNDWLCKKSSIDFYSEGRLIRMSNKIINS